MRTSVQDGICTRRKEHTQVSYPCCNAPVLFEGSTYTLDDFCDCKECQESEPCEKNCEDCIGCKGESS